MIPFDKVSPFIQFGVHRRRRIGSHDFENLQIGLLVDEGFLIHHNGEAVELRLRGVQGTIQPGVVGQHNALHMGQGVADTVDVIRCVVSCFYKHVLHVVRLRCELPVRDEQYHAAATATHHPRIRLVNSMAGTQKPRKPWWWHEMLWDRCLNWLTLQWWRGGRRRRGPPSSKLWSVAAWSVTASRRGKIYCKWQGEWAALTPAMPLQLRTRRFL